MVLWIGIWVFVECDLDHCISHDRLRSTLDVQGTGETCAGKGSFLVMCMSADMLLYKSKRPKGTAGRMAEGKHSPILTIRLTYH